MLFIIASLVINVHEAITLESNYWFTEKMKKAYLILSSIASGILLIIPCAWLFAIGGDGLVFAMKNLLIGGISIAFWFLVALASFVVAINLPKRNENLKNVLLAFPILTLILLFTVGEYHGP